MGIFIAFIGACIVGLSPIIKGGEHGQTLGNLLIFLSLVSGAACGVVMKRLMRNGVPADFLANLSFVVGFLTILPFVVIRQGLPYTLSVLHLTNPVMWFGILYMAIVSGNLGYILNNLGQKSIELSEAAPFSYVYPIISAILAIAFLGDRPTLAIMVGAGITLVGVVLAEIKRKRYNP